ncbi:MAG: 50S ribosomal protein L29 [Anaerolineae bacterium]
MKISEIRSMTDEELERQLLYAREELFNLRFRLATKQLDDTSGLRRARKTIARIKTVMREREIARMWESELA